MRASSRNRIALTALGIALLGVAGGFALRSRTLDGEALRAQLDARLEAALPRPVELSSAELSLLPLPALRIGGLRVELAPGLTLQAPDARVELSLPALLFGRVAPRALVVRNGVLEHARLKLEGIALHGKLGDERSAFDFSGDVPGLGRVERGRIELAPAAGGGEPTWTASAQIAELELAALCRRLELPGVAGVATGALEASGRGGAAESASLTLESELALGDAGLRLRGPTRARFALGGVVDVDLAQAELAVGDFVKPYGVPLRLSGTLAKPAQALRIRDLHIDSERSSARGELDLAAGLLDLNGGEVSFADLAAWKTPSWLPASGRVAIERVLLHFDPLAFHGEGQLADFELPLTEQGVARVSGRVWSDGQVLVCEALRGEIAGEALSTSLLYDPARGEIDVVLGADGARVGPIVQALWGRSDVSGRLYGRVELSGPPDLYSLIGRGEIEVRDGDLPGISLRRTAGLKDVYDDEFEELPDLDRFDSLAGRFELDGDQLQVTELTLYQRHAFARVNGPLSLRDLHADFTGEATFDFAEPSVRPILRMAGPLTQLETHISDGRPETQKMERDMIEAIRQAEAAQRAGNPDARVPAPVPSGG